VTTEDHDGLPAHWTAPDVRRFLFDGAILSSAEIRRVIEDSMRDFAAAGYGLWLIQEKGTTDPVGTVGLRPLEDLGLEILYSLASAAQGKGYATEAARCVVAHAFDALGLPEILAEIDEGNIGSTAVVQRLGMTPFAVVPSVLGPLIRYRTTR
jgi:RimJ/RimL family protein N-acetyltransferase